MERLEEALVSVLFVYISMLHAHVGGASLVQDTEFGVIIHKGCIFIGRTTY